MAALGTAFASGTRSALAQESKRPNILFIITDEHRAAITGCYGNKIVRTPNLDELASRGIVFDSCYTNSPLCVPSRLSITSGKYASRVSAWNNACELSSNDIPSIASMVRAQGYDTILCGKMHYAATRNYGFSVIGPPNNFSKNGKGSRRPYDDTEVNSQDWKARSNTFHVGDTSGVLNHDRAVQQVSCDFLANRKKSDKPFFMTVGFDTPHYPLIVPEEIYNHYRGRIPPPNLPFGHVEMQPLNYQQLRNGFGLVNMDPTLVQKGRECYYGLTEWTDGNVGKVLDALRKSSVADNTVIIYTTDHGENMGEHGLWWKCCMYQTAAQIPLIISWPERWQQGERRKGVCSLVDVVQTMARLAGATPPHDWNGDSLIPLIQDEKHEWKDMAVSEYYAHNISSGYVMLRQGKYKYVYHTRPVPNYPNERELYDLESDPNEFVNLVSLPEHQKRLAEMHALLVKEVGEDPEKTEQRCRADIAVGYAHPFGISKGDNE
jgi:choline-sulfatase